MRPVILAAALFAVACNNPPAEPRVPGAVDASGEPAYTINGDIKVYQNMWDSVLERIPPEQRSRMAEAPNGMKRLEDQMAMSQILYTKALEEGIADDPTVSTGLAMAERDYLAAMYVQRKGEAAVTDEAIAKAYEEKKVQYARPQVKARHILVKEEDKATEIKAKIDAGGDFGALAKEFSVDPGSKDKGGDLGWFEKRRMDPAFGEAAFAAEKGAVVGPVQSRFGFHIIEVQDKRETVPLEDVKEEIAAGLRQEAIQGLLKELQDTMTVQKAGEPAPEAKPAEGEKPAGDAPTPEPAHGADDGHNH